MTAVAVVLSAFSNGYGFHRDELYFRVLSPGWGYVDQPPLTPLLVRLLSEHVADSPWAVRIPATASTVASVLVIALITRELGGGRAAQALSAWGYAFAATPLLFGHVMLTSSLDLVVWPLVTLFVLRAALRGDPRWWLWAGVVVGLSMSNKLLVAMLLVALAAGVALVGPRRLLGSPWVLGSAVLALIVGSPNLIYQATHRWPELTMGRALSAENAGDVHALMWPFLFLLLGPPLTAIWVAGLVSLWRRPAWRPVRFVAVAFPVLLVLVYVAGSQFYYPYGLLAVLYAAGCVPTGELISRSAPWRALTVAGVALNAVICSLLALPLVPLSALGSTPIPAINQTARDTVGWPTYVQQIADVYDAMPPRQAVGAVIVASNYGEDGAVDRYGPTLGLPRAYSAHNQLYFQARPPADTTVVIFVGGELQTARTQFANCTVKAHLDNGVDVVNEEEGEPIALCTGPRSDWARVWAALQHND